MKKGQRIGKWTVVDLNATRRMGSMVETGMIKLARPGRNKREVWVSFVYPADMKNVYAAEGISQT